jgi:hypothetical protein
MANHRHSGPLARAALAVGALLSLSGCFTLQVIEPVIPPPAQYTGDVTVPVEFAIPGTIGLRCAERGATFLGLPGITSGACADTSLITMLDPCLTLTAGPYAQGLCEGLRRHRDEAELSKDAPEPAPPLAPPAGLIRASFTTEPAPRTARPGAAETRRRPQTTAAAVSSWDNVVVEFVEADALSLRCAERGAKMTAGSEAPLSCADRLMVSVVNPCSSDQQSWYTRTLCHELAHVNGWPADHPAHHRIHKDASQSPQALAYQAWLDAAAAPAPSSEASHTGADDALAEPAPALPADLQGVMASLVMFAVSGDAHGPWILAPYRVDPPAPGLLAEPRPVLPDLNPVTPVFALPGEDDFAPFAAGLVAAWPWPAGISEEVSAFYSAD